MKLEEFDALLEAGDTFVIKFGAEWCAPCKILKGYMEDIDTNVDVYDVDVDDSYELVARFKIKSVPTMLKFKDGEKMDGVLVGLTTKETLENFLNE